ncbi:hypothetical protein CCAX7_59150 [Capsulimonas corticalis]|uniref:Uncharacterized protein n=2 Tax=Capsulimonas corticalis TaxID=2219043 RepID=A0A402CZR6_9BACT|nr:hypothetical protein CCAX7_59150 [Capsulimonas corticalis]
MKGRRRRSTRGAVIVEFAVVITFLTVMLFGIIQYAVILNATNTLSHLSREGARFAAVHSMESTADQPATTAGSIRNYIQTACSNTTISYAQINQVTISPAQSSPTRAAGSPITVSIQYDISQKYFMKDFIPGTSSGPVYITRTTTELIE